MKLTLEETKIYKELEKRKASKEVLGNLVTISKECKRLLAKVNSTFPHFTNHDICHSYRVADFMYELLPCSEEKYCDSELIIMLYVAMMHDLGMVDASFDSKSPDNLEELRKNHHHKSAETIMREDMFGDNLFLIDGISVRREVADVAKSHNESVKWIVENIRERKGVGKDSVNLRFICYLLRIADLIDFDNQRTPLIVYNFFKKEFKKDEWKISDDEWTKQLSVTNFNHVIIDKEKRICRIFFEAEVESSLVCRNLFRYFKYIEKEISEIERFKSADERYTFYIDPKVEQNVEQNGFDVKPLIQYVDYLSVANILIGENIYDKKEYALREIVQNAMDAVLLMKEIKKDPSYVPQISIRINDNCLFVEDNGIGMTREVIEKYFLCIGKSFYKSKEYTYAYKPISHYGVGFLSSYLLSKKIVVWTSSYKDSNKLIELELNKDDEYVVFSERKQEISKHGTIVGMSLDDVLAVFWEKEKIKRYLENTFVNPKISIIFNDGVHGDEIVRSIEFDESYGEYLNGILLKCDVETHQELVFSCNDFLCGKDYAIVENSFINSDMFRKNGTSLLLDSLITDNDRIYSVDVRGLSIDQKQILDDNGTWCDSSDIISDKFSEFFDEDDMYARIVEVYGKEETFEDVPDKDDVIDDKNCCSLNHDDGGLFREFAKKEMRDCDRFLVEKKMKKIIVNKGFYSFFKEGMRFDSSHANNYNIYPMALFVKNVRIEEASLIIPYVFSNLILRKLKVNVLDNCVPNLSRSKILQNVSLKIGYAVGRAIHMALLKKGVISGKKMSEQELELLEKFINKYYSEKNEFCS